MDTVDSTVAVFRTRDHARSALRRNYLDGAAHCSAFAENVLERPGPNPPFYRWHAYPLVHIAPEFPVPNDVPWELIIFDMQTLGALPEFHTFRAVWHALTVNVYYDKPYNYTYPERGWICKEAPRQPTTS